MSKVTMDPTWKEALGNEFEKPYFKQLSEDIRNEYLTSTIYPPAKQVFRAFDLCPLDQVSVVIVGQDPYHGKGQANGLCFAVNDGVTVPPSLKNIYKEIQSDIGIMPDSSGDLTRWAEQGVLLLNAVLTVRAASPASHKGRGWEQFTDAVIETLNRERSGIVYMLWGRYAQDKGMVIDRDANLVLESAHPSPYSASKFFGCRHFSRCNEYLHAQGKAGIDWT